MCERLLLKSKSPAKTILFPNPGKRKNVFSNEKIHMSHSQELKWGDVLSDRHRF